MRSTERRLVPDGAEMMGDGQLGGEILDQGPEYSNPEGSAELARIHTGPPWRPVDTRL